ncbi:MAG: hypothetical protein Q8K75_00980 [Chlamydiales bacterium]|nr:hypothetical protein [Chlamydiales bacterium]
MDTDNRLQKSHQTTPYADPQQNVKKQKKKGQKNITPLRNDKNILIGHERSAEKASSQKPTTSVRRQGGPKAHQIKKESSSFSAKLQEKVAAIKDWAKNIFRQVRGEGERSEVNAHKNENKETVTVPSFEARETDRKQKLESFKSEIISLGGEKATFQTLNKHTMDLFTKRDEVLAERPTKAKKGESKEQLRARQRDYNNQVADIAYRSTALSRGVTNRLLFLTRKENLSPEGTEELKDLRDLNSQLMSLSRITNNQISIK